jgi:hypothetical protein
MTSLRDLVTQIRIALATHPKVTVNHPKPKQLWRALKRELPVCDVTFDDHAVHVSWKAGEGETDEGEKLIPGKYVEVVLAEGITRR